MHIHFITVCDKPSNAKQLKSSLNSNLTILDTYDIKIGNISKIIELQKCLLNNNDIDQYDIIVNIDAYDVLWTGHNTTESLIRDFKETGMDLIIAGESIYTRHDLSDRDKYDNLKIDYNYNLLHVADASRCNRKYINGGFTIAYKWAYLKMIDHILDKLTIYGFPDVSNSEQRIIGKFYLENMNIKLIKMCIDVNSIFVDTINSETNIPENIISYFVHVTWLSNIKQKFKYTKLLFMIRRIKQSKVNVVR